MIINLYDFLFLFFLFKYNKYGIIASIIAVHLRSEQRRNIFTTVALTPQYIFFNVRLIWFQLMVVARSFLYRFRIEDLFIWLVHEPSCRKFTKFISFFTFYFISIASIAKEWEEKATTKKKTLMNFYMWNYKLRRWTCVLCVEYVLSRFRFVTRFSVALRLLRSLCFCSLSHDFLLRRVHLFILHSVHVVAYVFFSCFFVAAYLCQMNSRE